MKQYEYEVVCRPLIGTHKMPVLVYANDEDEAKRQAVALGFDAQRHIAVNFIRKL